jgi:hypothetical protein
LQSKLPSIAAAVDAQLQAEFIGPSGGLLNVVMQGGRTRAQLTAKLHEVSRQAVNDALVGINILESKLAQAGSQATSEMRAALAAATPSLLAFGGRRRILAALPRTASASLPPNALSGAFGTEVTVVTGCSNDMALCVEADGLSLSHIAAEMVDHRRDRIEFAGRVHSRNDISWTPLIASSVTPVCDVWGSEAMVETASQQALCKTSVM